MKLNLIAAITVGGFITASVQADDSDVDFMVQEKCTSCHESAVYTRPDRRVHSLQQLSAMVRACNTETGAQWFDDEVDLVIDYLNRQYYKFDE